MNPLKERTATTKGIKTLFISSVLLVGFIGMSLSLSQTASATAEGGPPEGSPSENRPTPQCDDDERFVPGEGCVKPPTCPPEADRVTGSGDTLKCFDVVELTNRVPGPCPATHPIPDGDKCAQGVNSQGKPTGQRVDRPPACPPETDEQTGSGSTLKCFDVKELQPIPGEVRKPGQGNQ
jgi:hypothetical protein